MSVPNMDMPTPIDPPLALVRLLQLASPALPVGAFGYSQGLEWAVEDGTVSNQASAQDWIEGILLHLQARLDVPILARMYDVWQTGDRSAIDRWNGILLAGRETRELREEELHLGQALIKLLDGMQAIQADYIPPKKSTFAAAFSLAAVQWNIPKAATVNGYLWAWLENQVLAAIKLVPLGQLAGQRMLFELGERIPKVIDRALEIEDSQIGAALPFLAIASSRHESQYTRLFRS